MRQRITVELGCGSTIGLVVRTWPEPVERVAAHVRERGADARIEEFTKGTPTASAAARAVGCDQAQIVKSLVFICDGHAVLALVPGDRRADAAKVAAAASAGYARVAASDEVLAATGFEPGAVAPFPAPKVERVLLERELLLQEIVWVGAGSANHMAGLAPMDLLRLAGALPVDLTES
jgi:prolyl-tRNA editing enzyme YbaK/EbsC (Cys-tRNA(Pro) deacylase)